MSDDEEEYDYGSDEDNYNYSDEDGGRRRQSPFRIAHRPS